MQSGFKIAAVILFSLAAVCVLVSLILYFAWHIRQIRDDLTGKTAQRRIAELRKESGRWQAASKRSAATADRGPDWSIGQVNGLLESDQLGDGPDGNPLSGQGVEPHDEEDQGTTLLAGSGSSSTPVESHPVRDDEDSAGQTKGIDVQKEPSTTLLQKAAGGSDQTAEEFSQTTLLAGVASNPEEEEQFTTLLGSRSAK
ncbi:hypothetical protein GA0061078_1219 [Bifidobacterium bohemicum]|uniref:Uncharacterized protein n=1 Tax=Bifidobacterium bohemicum DSM 22767 TaxID=1437606 RepID=A0A086ZG87_9BIFI|nr:hypothetical protein [Bifidobacterium bohemicum]KFI45537.1 hypothetical protein BBOH_1052 [Bifidobacterium bohemicum DSM 22767]SCC02523.1 hypothetical protein GA0061078_1219 [Bifidobacterium bohemicum]